ncbi:MAG: hypothetical protein J6C17_03345 [Clostridia bacterium]|nr:hypothetical protein [Clostridia bacterium]
MDLRRIKTITIAVLLIIFIMLSGFLISLNRRDKAIEKEANEQVVALLGKSNIILDKNLIPEKNERVEESYVEKIIPNDPVFIEKLLGKGYTKKEGHLYENENKRIMIEGASFSYMAGESTDSVKINDKTQVESYCREKLKWLGADEKLYAFSGVNMTDNTVKALFSGKYEKYEYFDSFITFELTEKGVKSVQAKNLLSSSTASQEKTSLFSINSILLDIAGNPEMDKEKKTSVISIAKGYYIGRESDYKKTMAVPVWQIALDDGTIMYYDARNGNYIEM